MYGNAAWILTVALVPTLVFALALRSAGHARAQREARKLFRTLHGGKS